MDDLKGHDVINVHTFFGAGDVKMNPSKQGAAFCAALLPDLLKSLGELVTEGVT